MSNATIDPNSVVTLNTNNTTIPLRDQTKSYSESVCPRPQRRLIFRCRSRPSPSLSPRLAKAKEACYKLATTKLLLLLVLVLEAREPVLYRNHSKPSSRSPYLFRLKPPTYYY